MSVKDDLKWWVNDSKGRLCNKIFELCCIVILILFVFLIFYIIYVVESVKLETPQLS